MRVRPCSFSPVPARGKPGLSPTRSPGSLPSGGWKANPSSRSPLRTRRRAKWPNGRGGSNPVRNAPYSGPSTRSAPGSSAGMRPLPDSIQTLPFMMTTTRQPCSARRYPRSPASRCRPSSTGYPAPRTTVTARTTRFWRR